MLLSVYDDACMALMDSMSMMVAMKIIDQVLL